MSISRNLQEDLIILLAFDDKNAKFVRNMVDSSLFEGVYNKFTARLYSYIDQYGNAPKDALPLLYDDVIEGEDKRKAKTYIEIITHIFEAKDSVNVRYALDRITNFIRQQEFKKGILEAANILNEGSEDCVDRAEYALSTHVKKKLDVFDPGIFLGDTANSLSFLTENKRSSFTMGIPCFDKRGVGPARGEVFLLIGVYNRGKSWALINLGKRAIMENYKVCHLSLEMSSEQVRQRYFQALFSIAKREDKYASTSMVFDNLNRLLDLKMETIKPNMSFSQSDIYDLLSKRIAKFGHKLNKLLVQRYPTGSLSIKQLENYLDNLEDRYSYTPDLLLLDYADLMKLDTENYRLDLGKIMKDLRGIAVSRNIAIATVTQSNREGGKSKRVTGVNVAEDWSKLATVDTAVTYSQTEEEQKLNLARLYVDKARDDEARFTAVITQSYNTGQFVIDSAYMEDSYFDLVEATDAEI